MTQPLQDLRRLDVLTALDVQFANAMGRIADEKHPDVLLAAALASHVTLEGHVCAHLARFANNAILDEHDQPVADLRWPALEPWTASLIRSPLVGVPGDFRPLVLDPACRFYLYRYWLFENRVATQIRMRSSLWEPDVDGPKVVMSLERFFGPVSPTHQTDQQVAALLAVLRRLCIITGGPGTGKTTTVVRILAILAELRAARGLSPAKICLLAPTGKASARLTESISAAKQSLQINEEILAQIPDHAATLHRALVPIPETLTQFMRHEDNPLDSDIVVVDEASMVDLALMARLVSALPTSARLILLGDRDQLASVEAGAVLGHLCGPVASPGYSPLFVQQVQEKTGLQLQTGPKLPTGDSLRDCQVVLRENFRFGQDSGIAALAGAIQSGQPDLAIALLDERSEVPSSDLRLVEWSEGQWPASFSHIIAKGYGPYLKANDIRQRLDAFERFRVLCPLRHGPFGLEAVNRFIVRILAEHHLLRPFGRFYPGRPVMVTVNDYHLGLFNGDIGLLETDEASSGNLHAVFRGQASSLRRIAPARLPAHETVFALSVHKSQGSEFDEAVIVMPARDCQILTRELLYTAVTRARHRVTLFATRQRIIETISRRSERSSGLYDALWK